MPVKKNKDSVPARSLVRLMATNQHEVRKKCQYKKTKKHIRWLLRKTKTLTTAVALVLRHIWGTVKGKKPSTS